MHILIAIITAAAGLIWALVRLQNSGVDLNSFNPFWWVRRRRWQKIHGSNPLHTIGSSLEAAAVLVVGIAKIDVEITRDTKSEILSLFVEAFNISETEANTLFSASSHLLKDASNLVLEVKNILAPTLADFTQSQITSVLAMLDKVSVAEAAPSTTQQEYITEVKQQFNSTQNTSKNW